MNIPLRPPAEEDLAAMVALNNEFAVETSFLTRDAMRRLIDVAFHVRVAGQAEAFCIALDQGANHDSPNLAWFRQRLERFVYIDRVIVVAHAHGRGIARVLYRDLIVAAKNAGHTVLCCEVNVSPPNPGSDRFHDAFGFVETGRAFLADRAKTVRYLALEI
jgi:predicted GNAT superfamily acetyltransferase